MTRDTWQVHAPRPARGQPQGRGPLQRMARHLPRQPVRGDSLHLHLQFSIVTVTNNCVMMIQRVNCRESVFSQERILYSFSGENVLNSTRW